MKRLDALNMIIEAVGVLPVSTYDSSHPDAVGARPVLERFTSEIQERGWWFNRDYELKLVPDVSGRLLLPATCLKVEALDLSGATNWRNSLIQRGNYLYDMRENTDIINETVYVDIVNLQDFDNCPIPIQTYIARSAAYEYATVHEGDQQKLDRLQKFAFNSRSEAMADELRNGNFNAHKTGAAARMLGGIHPFMRR